MKNKNLLRTLCISVMSCILLCGCGGNKTENNKGAGGTSAAGTEATSSGAETTASETAVSEASAPDSTSETETQTTVNQLPTAKAVDWTAFGKEIKEKAETLNKSASKNSITFAFMDDGKIVSSGVSGQNATEETVYGIASISKMMAVTAVMQLAENGKVELDAHVTKYLPDFRMADERYKQITVRMLMNHSSGLMGNTCGNGWRLGAFGDMSYHDGFLDMLSTQRLRSDPGAYGNYCNDGFTLLELICERVSGVSYSEYLRKNIFEPLGMKYTFSPLEIFDTSALAVSDYGGMGELAALTVDPAQGGMFSNAFDICLFGQTFTSGGSGILSAASVKAMAEAEYKRGIWCEDGQSTMNYGLGWDSVDFYPFSELGIKSVAKNGDVVLSGSQVIILPEYNLVAAATCSGSLSSSCKQLLTYGLLRILQEKGLIDQIPERPVLTETDEPVPESLYAFEGTYLRTSEGVRVEFSDDSMSIAPVSGGGKKTFKHIGNGHFTDNGVNDYWFEEHDGKQYMILRSWSDSSSLVPLPNVTFQYTKTDEVPSLPDEVREAWSARNGKTYLLVSEPYDSLGYIYPTFGLALPAYKLTVSVKPDVSPFWRGMRITGVNTAENAAEVPISGSTSSVDAVFSQVDGVEYITFSNGLVYRSAEGIEKLDTSAVIKAGEQTRWYRVENDEDVRYSIPENCAIAVYDDTLRTETNTFVTGEDEIELEEDFYVAFIGNGEFAPLN